MVDFTESDDLRGARFVATSLAGAHFERADLSGVVMRGVDLAGAELDSPWLLEEGSTLLVNGVDIVPLVDAELDRRFPGRELRRASDPESLRAAWAAIESSWADVLARVEQMPAGTVDMSIGGEWSFSQTLRHLVMATDTWLRKAIQGIAAPYHPLGQPHVEYATDGYDTSVFRDGIPTFAEVLAARADRVAMVRDFIAGATPELLAAPRPSAWSPQVSKTVLSCLHTILEEEWEHQRYAVRDLDAIAAGRDGAGDRATGDVNREG